MSSASGVVLADRYRLEERIAAGGYGEVWRGVDVTLNRPVGVKLLLAAHARDPQTLARFRAEAQHAAALAHPNIARVYDYAESDPPYLVMEFVDGPSLAGLLSNGPMDPVRVMDIVAQTASGLYAAHQSGLVHRDVKPGNLLLSHGSVVKITDFGISYAVESVPLTTAGTLMGTPGYIAPERINGIPAGPASDLYSLGVVAYECLMGAPPFAGTGLEVALAHRDRPMPPLAASIPAGVGALVGELTAKDPAARPASAGEVAQRAAQIRDSLGGGETARMPVEGAAAAPTMRDFAPTAVLADGPPPRRRRSILPAAIGVGVLAAGLLALILANALGGAPSHTPGGSTPSVSSSQQPSGTTQPSGTPSPHGNGGHPGKGGHHGHGHGHGDGQGNGD